MNSNLVLNNVKNANNTILSVTNFVSVNDLANLILATNNSPIMSLEVEEMDELTSICAGVNINIGTATKLTSIAISQACKSANELNKVLCLDPVGAGATNFRSNLTNNLLQNFKFDVICCNVSEFLFIANKSETTSGVDANTQDLKLFENKEILIKLVKKTAKKLNTTIVVSGPLDIVSDGTNVGVCYNGTKQMAQVTGCGCMLSALITTFVSANKNDVFSACLTSCIIMGLSGEKAAKKVVENNGGNASLRMYLIDNINILTNNGYDQSEAKYEIL